MKSDIINEIISIINSDCDLHEKRSNIRALQIRRRKENKQLLNIVCSLLNIHTLPIRFCDGLNLYPLENATENHYTKLRIIYKKSKCVLFNAICGEVLFKHYHEISFATKAIDSYSLEFNNAIENDSSDFCFYAISVCRLYTTLKNTSYDFSDFFSKVTNYIRLNFQTLQHGISSTLNALSNCNYNPDDIESLYKLIINHYETLEKYDDAIIFLEHLCEFYKRQGNKVQEKECLKQIAKFYEKSADQYDWDLSKNASRIVHLIQSAMKTWEKANDKRTKSERNRLAKRIEPIKKELLKSLKTIQAGELDISELIIQLEEFINEASLEQVVYRLAKSLCLKDPNKLKDDIQSEEFLFSSFFSTNILDSEGRILCVIPPFETTSPDTIIPNLEFRASRDYMHFAEWYVNRYLFLAKKRFDFTEENLAFLVENNIFVPENRKRSFLKGLVAGFNLDLITSMHLLMPQVENSIRNIAHECGAVVYKTRSDGVEECLSLKVILNLPELTDCLEEQLLFNLKLFYESEYGFGMRNFIGHGLYSDDELMSGPCLAVWWFTLLICCTYSPELHKRLVSQNKTDN